MPVKLKGTGEIESPFILLNSYVASSLFVVSLNKNVNFAPEGDIGIPGKLTSTPAIIRIEKWVDLGQVAFVTQGGTTCGKISGLVGRGFSGSNGLGGGSVNKFMVTRTARSQSSRVSSLSCSEAGSSPTQEVSKIIFTPPSDGCDLICL